MKESMQGAVPQAPDWELEPMNKEEGKETHETALELEPMTLAEATEKYAVAETAPTEPTVEQVAILDEQRDRIAQAFEDKQEHPEDSAEKQKEADVYNKKFELLEDFAKDTGASLIPGENLVGRFYDVMRKKELQQERTRLKVGMVGMGVTAAGMGTAWALVGLPALALAGPVGLGASMGVMAGMKLYHSIRNKRLAKQYQDIH